MAGRIARGEVRLFPFQSPDKLRPVVVLTRSIAINSLAHLTVAPITSAIRGVPSEVRLNEDDGVKGPCVVNLHHTVTIDKSLLGRRVAQLSAERMREICAALSFALGCDAI